MSFFAGGAIPGGVPPAFIGAMPGLSAAPVISGTVALGQTLTVSDGTWTGSPTAFVRQWFRDALPIDGATASTYVLTSADVGRRIGAEVIARNGSGPSLPAAAAQVGPVAAPPVHSSPPVISGVPRVGLFVSARPGIVLGVPTPSISYQWRRGAANIAGATSAGYIVAEADEGQLISCRLTATNSAGSAVADTAAIGPVTAGTPAPPEPPVNTVLPAITGTPAVGETLSCSTGTWTGTLPITYTYQWRRGAVDIAGATASTYLLIAADEGETISCRVTATNAAGSADVVSADVVVAVAPVPLTEFRDDGWSATYDGTPPATTLDADFTATYPGFDATGSATTWAITNRICRRVRQPGVTTLDANRVSLAYPVYTGTVATGVTNNSTREAPKPIVNWAMVDRVLIGDEDFTAQVTAFHGWARAEGQVACVEFTLTDGTNTLTRLATSMEVIGGTPNSRVIGYRTTFPAADIATLANAVLTLNVRVFPWVGVSSSIYNSATETDPRLCGPRYILKDTGRRADAPRCYIDAAGNDATGIWGTAATDAAAAAAPFATIAGALAAGKISAIPAGANAALLPAGTMDGCQIRLRAGTFASAWIGSGTQQFRCAAVEITRDPAVARADAIMQMGNQVYRLGGFSSPITASCVRIRDITIDRPTGSSIWASTGAQTIVQIVDCDWVNNNDTSLQNSTVDRIDIYDTTFTIAGALNAAANRIGTMMGNSCSAWNGKSVWAHHFIGNDFRQMGIFIVGTITPIRNRVVAFNRFRAISIATNPLLPYGGAEDVEGLYIGQNLWEIVNTTSTAISRLSSDSGTGNLTHVIEEYNTNTGFNGVGRHNFAYVDASTPTASRDRVHREIWTRGNVYVQMNAKHDLFGTADPLRVGGWWWNFGCGAGVYISQFQDAGGGSFRPEYLHPQTLFHTSNTARLDVGFTDYRGTVDASTSGAGDGDYRPATTTLLRNRLPSRTLPFDLEGNARSATNDTCGAYV